VKIETKFGVGDKVLIVDLENTRAVIRGVCIAADGVTYHVYWFHDGKQQDAWVYDSEITTRTK